MTARDRLAEELADHYREGDMVAAVLANLGLVMEAAAEAGKAEHVALWYSVADGETCWHGEGENCTRNDHTAIPLWRVVGADEETG